MKLEHQGRCGDILAGTMKPALEKKKEKKRNGRSVEVVAGNIEAITLFILEEEASYLVTYFLHKILQ